MKRRGFTLVELMVVITLAALMLGFGVVSATRLRLSARISAFIDARKTLETALRTSFIHNGFIEDCPGCSDYSHLPSSIKPYITPSFELSKVSYMNGRGDWSWSWNPQANEFSITLITRNVPVDWQNFKKFFDSQLPVPTSGFLKMDFVPDAQNPERIVSTYQVGI